MISRTVIGITPDVEFCEGEPSRDFYNLDTTVVAALRAAGCATVMLPHVVDDIDSYLGIIDGVVISGGDYQFQDERLFSGQITDSDTPNKYQRTLFELELIRSAVKRGIPCLGICGGFQSIQVAFGGKIVINIKRDCPGRLDHGQLNYNSTAHHVSVIPGTRLAAIAGMKSFSVNSLHQQGVAEVPAALLACAHADDGIIEAIELPGDVFCVGVQWHPEFHTGESDRKILQAFVSAC